MSVLLDTNVLAKILNIYSESFRKRPITILVSLFIYIVAIGTFAFFLNKETNTKKGLNTAKAEFFVVADAYFSKDSLIVPPNETLDIFLIQRTGNLTVSFFYMDI